MKIILHIGMTKTGSTALQQSLADARELLLKRGVLYPRVNTNPINHNFLSLFLCAGALVPRTYASKYKGNYDLMMEHAKADWQKIKVQVAKLSPSTIVLSGELIFKGMTSPDISQFVLKLKELTNDIEVVMYIRQPSNAYLSTVQQRLKASSTIPPVETINFRQHIEACQAAFGKRPTIFAYEQSQLTGSDIYVDFCNRCLASIDVPLPTTTKRINESLSAESMAILQEYRAINYPKGDDCLTSDSIKLFALLKDVETNFNLRTKPTLKSELAWQIDYRNSELEWLFRVYGIKFNNIDYEKLQSNQEGFPPKLSKVSDLCDVDEVIKQKILMLVMSKRLNFKKSSYIKKYLEKWMIFLKKWID